MWQDMWAVRKGDWKLIYKGHDTTGKYSTHPEMEFEMPEYYLANLEDEHPEEINHASQHPEIVKELNDLHKIWAKDVFKDSGYEDPNSVTGKKESLLKTKGTKKL
jgi:hypothetical protein